MPEEWKNKGLNVRLM